MKIRVNVVRNVYLTAIAVLVVVLVIWLTGILHFDAADAPVGPTARAERDVPVLRIGLIPERDIFKQRRRYRALADYVSEQLGGPIELVTSRTYEGILKDFKDKKIDAAFLGSLVTVLAMDRLGIKILAKPEMPGGINTYHGVIFVRQDSPILRLEDLKAHTIGMVYSTTAAHLFPACVITKLELMNPPNPIKPVWIGTHDDVALKVMDGNLDAGAIKNLRLDALELSHPEWKIRRLANGQDVPTNALCLRAG